jgi:hypothetical protein
MLAHGPGRRSVQRYQRRCLAARLTNTAALAADPVLPHSCNLFSPANQSHLFFWRIVACPRHGTRPPTPLPPTPRCSCDGVERHPIIGYYINIYWHFTYMSGISPADYSYVERGLRRFRSRFYNYTASAPPAVAVPRLSLPGVAVPFDQARLALPERPAAVHLLDVLPPTLARLFEAPNRLIDLVPRSSRPRARCYHAVPNEQYLPLLRQLLPLNMIKLHWYQNDLSPVGLFAVPKGDCDLRMIADARPGNARREGGLALDVTLP